MQYFDKVVYTFSADNEPTGTIDSGEIVIFRTQDCFSPKRARACLAATPAATAATWTAS